MLEYIKILRSPFIVPKIKVYIGKEKYHYKYIFNISIFNTQLSIYLEPRITNSPDIYWMIWDYYNNIENTYNGVNCNYNKVEKIIICKKEFPVEIPIQHNVFIDYYDLMLKKEYLWAPEIYLSSKLWKN